MRFRRDDPPDREEPEMMNLIAMPKMNAMMVEDVTVSALRSLRSHEKAGRARKHTHTSGMWNETLDVCRSLIRIEKIEPVWLFFDFYK